MCAPGLNRVLEVQCTYPHVCFLCLALVRGQSSPVASLLTVWITRNFPFEFNWEGLVWSFACKLGTTPRAARSCEREHNREPGASNVHLYGYYHGPWGSRWQVAYSLDRTGLSPSGINMRRGGVSSKRKKREVRSQSVNGVTTNPCSHNHTWKTRISHRQ